MYTVGKTHNFVWNNDTEYFDVYSMENKIDEDESVQSGEEDEDEQEIDD